MDQIREARTNIYDRSCDFEKCRWLLFEYMVVKDLLSDFAMTQGPLENKRERVVNMKSISFATVYEALLILTFSKFEKNFISSSRSCGYQSVLERD